MFTTSCHPPAGKPQPNSADNPAAVGSEWAVLDEGR